MCVGARTAQRQHMPCVEEHRPRGPGRTERERTRRPCSRRGAQHGGAARLQHPTAEAQVAVEGQRHDGLGRGRSAPGRTTWRAGGGGGAGGRAEARLRARGRQHRGAHEVAVERGVVEGLQRGVEGLEQLRGDELVEVERGRVGVGRVERFACVADVAQGGLEQVAHGRARHGAPGALGAL